MPAKYNRRSIRLQGHDYNSAGAYFITLCAADNEFVLACTGAACCALNFKSDLRSNPNPNPNPNSTDIFGRIDNGKMVLNDFGRIVEECLRAIPEHFPTVDLDEFVVMPNHVHFIVCIDDKAQDDVRAQRAAPVVRPRAGMTGEVEVLSKEVFNP